MPGYDIAMPPLFGALQRIDAGGLAGPGRVRTSSRTLPTGPTGASYDPTPDTPGMVAGWWSPGRRGGGSWVGA